MSRATFYRLFDGIDDALSYECDLVYEDVPAELEGMRLASAKDALTYFVGRRLAHRDLVEATARSASLGLVFDTHLRNTEIVRQACAWEDLADVSPACLDALFAGLVAAAIGTWCAHGEVLGSVDVVDEAIGGMRALMGTCG